MHRIIFKELWTVLVTWIIENFRRMLKIGNCVGENSAYLRECSVFSTARSHETEQPVLLRRLESKL